MPDWVTTACTEYGKRLPRHWLKIIEIPSGVRHNVKNTSTAIVCEGEKLLAATDSRDKIIALDVKGTPWGTEELSRQLASWRMHGDNINLLIGGPDGLSAECLVR